MDTYQNLCTQFYELDKPKAPEKELEFYLEYAENAHGPIYEPMCGTGRFLIPMLEKGLNIEGSDASIYMLAVCKEKCHALGLVPTLHHQFLHHMQSEKKYALIFIPSGSFGLITDVVQAKKCLKILYDYLLPNGKLVFEVETMHAVPKKLGIHQERFVSTKQKGESILLDTVSTYDESTQILETICDYNLILNNKIIQTEIEKLYVRYYQYNEMDEWLKQAGFYKVMRFKAYAHTPTDILDEIIVYECIK